MHLLDFEHLVLPKGKQIQMIERLKVEKIEMERLVEKSKS